MARERSPNYPAHSLPSAIQFAKLLWSKEERTAVELDVIASALGSIGVSGPVRSKVAAMRQYKLVQPVDSKMKVSDLAITLILQRPGQAEYDAAAKDAALAPSLFAALYKERPDASDEALSYYLVRDQKFSTEGATRAIRAYRETLAFAKLVVSSYSEGGDEAPDEEPEQVPAPSDRPTGPSEPDRARAREGKSVSFIFALPRGVQAEVTFHGSAPTKRAVMKLRQYLELFEDDLPDDVQGSPSSDLSDVPPMRLRQLETSEPE